MVDLNIDTLTSMLSSTDTGDRRLALTLILENINQVSQEEKKALKRAYREVIVKYYMNWEVMLDDIRFITDHNISNDLNILKDIFPIHIGKMFSHKSKKFSEIIEDNDAVTF